jgi:hypothetical protein
LSRPRPPPPMAPASRPARLRRQGSPSRLVRGLGQHPRPVRPRLELRRRRHPGTACPRRANRPPAYPSLVGSPALAGTHSSTRLSQERDPLPRPDPLSARQPTAALDTIKPYWPPRFPRRPNFLPKFLPRPSFKNDLQTLNPLLQRAFVHESVRVRIILQAGHAGSIPVIRSRF